MAAPARSPSPSPFLLPPQFESDVKDEGQPASRVDRGMDLEESADRADRAARAAAKTVEIPFGGKTAAGAIKRELQGPASDGLETAKYLLARFGGCSTATAAAAASDGRVATPGFVITAEGRAPAASEGRASAASEGRTAAASEGRASADSEGGASAASEGDVSAADAEGGAQIQRREAVLQVLLDEAEAMNGKVTAFLDRCKREAAEGATKVSPQFIDAVHEMRTPLSCLINFILEMPRTPEFFLTLRRNYARLCKIVNDIPNDPSLKEKIQIHLAPFSLEQLREQVLMQMSSYDRAMRPNIAFHIPQLDCNLIGDKHRLRQLLDNFLSNAIKYSGKNAFEVFVEIDAAKGIVKFKVVDHGEGIPDKKKLFKLFSQVHDRSQPSTHDNSGVGLAYCKEVAELMNEGREAAAAAGEARGAARGEAADAAAGEAVIGADDTEGGGSTFWFTIPYRTAPKEIQIPPTPTPATSQLAVQGLPILAADDTEGTLSLYKTFLKDAALTTVKDGDLAVEAFQRAAVQGRPIPIVILDMHMPRMGGAEAAKRIQQIARNAHIIVASADSEDIVRDELRAAEVDLDPRRVTILSKSPLRRPALLLAINEGIKLLRS